MGVVGGEGGWGTHRLFACLFFVKAPRRIYRSWTLCYSYVSFISCLCRIVLTTGCMHFLFFVVQALCITRLSFFRAVSLVFFMNAEISFVVFVLENYILSFWFSILKIGRIKPVMCMKMGIIKGNRIVVETRTTLSNWN